MSNRYWISVAAIAVAAAIAGVYVARMASQPASPSLESGTSLPQPRSLADFDLVDTHGMHTSAEQLRGHPTLVFFGFTHCPDVCPTTLARMVRLRQQLGAGDRPFEILFVTVDPERDGPSEVGKYAELFNSPVTGLTGSPAQIDQVKKQFGIFSQKVPDSNGGYSVDHTSTVLLFDGKGEFSGTIAPEEGDSAALAKLKRITV